MRNLSRKSHEILGSIAGKRSFSAVRQPSLDKEFPGVPASTPFTATQVAETQVSTLSNGIRVATQETFGPMSVAGVFINTGSRYETHENNGISHFLEHMAFKSTEKRSALRTMRDIEEKGAIVGAQSSRDCIVYSGESLRDEIETVVQAVAETVLQPKISPWELDEQRKVLGYEIETMEDNAQQLVTEFLHAAAYGDSSSLGQPLWCPKRNLDKITSTDIKSFIGNNYVPSNMVIAATGVDHTEFTALAEKHFTTPANHQPSEEARATSTEYYGGMKAVPANTEFTHFAIGFNAGGWLSDDLLDICTLHMLLGGGGSFSAGGPGKGMYSRLYLNILNQCSWVDSAITLNTLYDTTGIFGIYGSAEPAMAGHLVAAISNELLALKSGTLTAEEVNRAKAQTKSALLMKLEERQVMFEDMGRQLLVYGHRKPAKDFSDKIDAITPESLKACAEKLLATKPSVAAFGNISAIPSYDAIARQFQ